MNSSISIYVILVSYSEGYLDWKYRLIQKYGNVEFFSGNADIAEMLTKSGVEINHKDNRGKTALHYTAEYGKQKFSSVVSSLWT